MDKLGLSPSDFAAYRRSLESPGQERKIRIHVLDLADGSHLRSLTPDVLDGQISYDVTGGTGAGVTRLATLSFFDHGGNLGFDPDDPSAAPIHRSREIRVVDSRFVPELGDWVDCPVFTGPVWDFQRNGGQVDITAHSRERQALGQLGETRHYKAKSKVTDAIRSLLATVGDVNANVPDLPRTLPHMLTLHGMDSAWPHIQHLAHSLDRYAFYDGAGRFHLRPHSRRPVFRFHRAMLGPVTVQRTADGIVNTVLVLGPKPHGPKARPHAHATFHENATLQGPLSPASLGRNGAHLNLIHQVTRDHLKTSKQAQAIADRLLREMSQVRTDIQFDSLPLPFLEEHDMVEVVDDTFGTAHLRMRQWTLPLTGGDAGGTPGTPMTVGFIDRTTKARLR